MFASIYLESVCLKYHLKFKQRNVRKSEYCCIKIYLTIHAHYDFHLFRHHLIIQVTSAVTCLIYIRKIFSLESGVLPVIPHPDFPETLK